MGFTLVYGIAELINFAHFNVFMVGSMVAMLTLQAFGLVGQETILTGLPLVGVLLTGFFVSMLVCGLIGMSIERFLLRPLAGREGAGGDDHHDRRVVCVVQRRAADAGVGQQELSRTRSRRCQFGDRGARCCGSGKIAIWAISLGLMGALTYFVSYTKLGKAMRATAQDPDAARMMGVEVDRVIGTAFFVGGALAGACGMIFGLYYNLAKVDIGFGAGLRAFTAAVLGGHRQRAGGDGRAAC